MLTIVLAIVGLLGLVVGVLSVRTIWRLSRTGTVPRSWRLLRRAGLVAGVLLGIASGPLTYWMGYPVATTEGAGRAVGIPFLVALFDSAGRDYVGPITLVGCLANGLFWFSVPQIITALVGRRLHRSELLP